MILITGASGLVGRRLVAALRLRSEERPLRVFDSSGAAEPLAGVEALRGDVTDRRTVADAVRGAEAVVHLAAKVDPGSSAADELRRVNVEGTEIVYAAAVEAGCGVFIHLSSAGVYGWPRGPDPFKESDEARPVTPYQRSKWDAEVALRRADHGGTTLNMLRPAGLYGPGSMLEIPMYRTISKRRWSIELAGGVVVQPTHVEDVVEAILALLERQAPHGTVFNVGGERKLLLAELQALIAQELGVRRRRFRLPPALGGFVVAAAKPLLARMGRRSPNLPQMSRGRLFSAAVDDSALRAQYPDIPVRPLAEGLREHIEWARAEGLLGRAG